MGSVATVLQKFTKQEGKTLLEGGQKIIDAIQKGTLKETKPAKNLLKVQDKKTAIIDKKKKIDVLPKEQSATTIKKEDFKIKKPKVEDKIADDFLDERKWNVDNRVKAKILRDFNIDKINTKQDVINLIEQISKTFAKDITKQKRGVQTHEVTKFCTIVPTATTLVSRIKRVGPTSSTKPIRRRASTALILLSTLIPASIPRDTL